MKLKLWLALAGVLILLGAGFLAGHRHFQRTSTKLDSFFESLDADENTPPAPEVAATPEEIRGEPADTTALGDYNVLIADRGNNRLLEVTPEKQIVWTYQFNLPRKGLGADDSFFTDNGQAVIVNLEEYHLIQIINYATKQVTWSYGQPGRPGFGPGMLNTPDDAYQLPNGNVSVADIKNCRVLELAPDKHVVRQYGVTRQCKDLPGFLDSPNGDTPLPDGGMLISNIRSKNVLELDQNWQPVFSLPLPVNYPSDPQATKAGNILVADYSNPGQLVEIGRDGKVVWQFEGAEGDVKLNHPSLAIELPNGNILCNDDFNHRVIVIDKQTKKIVWQYGVTGKPGSAAGQLNIPDGLDIIKRGVLAEPVSPPLTIGQVSRHPNLYLGQSVTVSGYVLAKQSAYVYLSDENGGILGRYDLPATGTGLTTLLSKQKYLFQGVLENQGLNASNHNPYYLKVTLVQKP